MCAHLPTAFHCNLQLQFKGVRGSTEGLKRREIESSRKESRFSYLRCSKYHALQQLLMQLFTVQTGFELLMFGILRFLHGKHRKRTT